MAALAQRSTAMTEAEYLAFERSSEIKHEYLNGQVFAMTGASEAHNLICGNLITTLNIQLRDRPCRVYPADMRVKVRSNYTYPDISVVCEPPQFADEEVATLLNPVVLIEVLSPSTERYDRGKKAQDYRQLASLREYLLVAQDSPRLEHYLRRDGDIWMLTDVIGLDTRVELPSVACTLALSDVYAKVSFEAGRGKED